MKQVSLQNKKNLRQRMNRLHLSVNKMVDYGVQLVHQGSLKKGSGAPRIYDDGKIDLDADFLIKTNDSGEKVRKEIFKAINANLRDHEKISNRKRVIRISVTKSGYTYHYDICIKNFDGKVAEMKDNKISWA